MKSLFEDLQCSEPYDQIINLVIDESNLGASLIACKRKDKPTIDILRLSYFFPDDQIERSSFQEEVFDKITYKTVLASISYSDPKLSSYKIMFSKDNSTVIFCSQEQNILVNLNKEKDNRHIISHMNGKHIRKIIEYQANQFLLVHAYSSDNEISIRHSHDPSFRLKIKTNYQEGCSKIKDFFIKEGQEIQVLVSRDNEEYSIHHFKNRKICFEQKIYEASNFVFNWPYICQVRGTKQVLVQSAMDPLIAIQVDLPLKNNEFISQMSLCEKQSLFIFVQTEKLIKIYQKDIGKIFKDLMKKKPTNYPKALYEKQMILEFDNSQIQNKEIEQVFIFNIPQASSPNIFLIVCDSKIYKFSSFQENLELIDDVYKMKKINDRLIAFQPFTARRQKSNQVKYLLLENSELLNGVLFKESQGSLEEFQIHNKILLCLIDSQKLLKSRLLKIYKISKSLEISLAHQINLNDQTIIKNLFTSQVFFDNMIVSYNNCYSLVTSYKEAQIQSYKNVLHLDQSEIMITNSPLQSETYRKLIFFKVKKMTYSHKTAIIMPYLNDNYIKFNDSQSTPQINLFNKFKDNQTNILKILPSEKQVHLYSMKGQIIRKKNLKPIYAECGDRIVGISQNGEYYLHANDKSKEPYKLNLIKICIENTNIERSNKETPTIVGDKEQKYQRPKINIKMLENINLKIFNIPDSKNDSSMEDVYQVFDSLNQRNCQIQFRINNQQDILISALYVDQKVQGKKYLKKLILLKKHENGKEEEDNRSVHLVQLEKVFQKEQKNKSVKGTPKEKLLYTENEFEDCFNCQISDQIIVAWSKNTLYYQELCTMAPYDKSILLKQVNLEMKDGDGYEIESVNIFTQGNNEWKEGNYSVIIKLVRENLESIFIRYNLFKKKSYSSHECHKDALICFNQENRSFILDQDNLIDVYENLPLYYYKVGFQTFKGSDQLNEYIQLGSRFSNYKQDSFFMIKNCIYMTYSYIDIVYSLKIIGKTLSKDNFDPERVFQLKGLNVFHIYVNCYSQLKFILDTYEQTNPKLINQLLLMNNSGKTALQLAIEAQNSNCVNLILEKLSHLSFNNVHKLKNEFGQLLQFNSFETYLSMILYQTKQMKNKIVLNCKEFSENEHVQIEPYRQLFLDKKFHQQVASNESKGKKEQIEKVRPVVIQALDAEWIFQTDQGKAFLEKLSQSDNLNYYGLESVRVIIKFLWNVYKPRIILYLFVPFLVNFSLFLFFSAYLYEEMHSQKDLYSTDKIITIIYYIIRFLLLAFSIYTYTIEYAQFLAEKRPKQQKIWSLIDLTSATLILIVLLMDWLAQCTDLNIKFQIRPIIALTQLILFLRLFYFLRIFDQTSYFVRFILNVSQDIIIILIILLIGIFASGSTFYILNNNNKEYSSDESVTFLNTFPGSIIYAYLLQIGYYQVDEFANSYNHYLLWLLFILATVFGIIIMFNTLVAIMSYSIKMDYKKHENLLHQEHLQLIVEKKFVVFGDKFDDVKYLIAIKDNSDNPTKDSVFEAVSKLQQNIKDMDSQIQNLQKENSQQSSYIDTLNAKIEEIEREKESKEAQKQEQEKLDKEQTITDRDQQQDELSQQNYSLTERGNEGQEQNRTRQLMANFLNPLLSQRMRMTTTMLAQKKQERLSSLIKN